MLMPKRVKHRKQFRGRMKGAAHRGNFVANGEIGLTIYPASQVASGAKAIEFVQMGTLDMCLDSTMALENFVPEDGVLNMPFIFSTKEEVYTTLDGPVGDELKAFHILVHLRQQLIVGI